MQVEIKGLAEAESKSINLNVVCLRFDAFYVGSNDVYFPLCPPVFSHAINNLKSALTGELKIVRLDHCTSPANGGREIFFLVERVTKKNIKVRFYELDDDDHVTWEDYGRFNDLDVHHQYAIVLKTPPYKNKEISSQVKVFVELVRPSDNARSEPKEFTYIPVQNQGRPGAKRSRPNEYSSDFDTLSIGSENLPATINLSGDFDIMSLTENLDSEELRIAMSNIDSDEFNKIFARFGKEYESADIERLSLDAPGGRSILQRKLNLKIKPCQNYEYMRKVQRVYQEISEFLKTKPNLVAVKEFMRHYLQDFKDEFNAFHMAVMINDKTAINFFIRLILHTGELDLVNVLSHKLGTVLHLATIYNNLKLVKILVSTFKADLSRKDADLNTPLHLAVGDFEGYMMDALLKGKDVDKCINSENGNNYTPLHLAVEKKNLKAVQLLCKNGADVDYRHACNGFTPLRFAVENGYLEIINFILYQTNVNPKVRDFNELDPLQVALHGSTHPEIKHVVQKYISENELPFEEINIKEEPEDITPESEMLISEVKVEPFILHDNLYINVTRFTDQCLDEVSRILDASGKWQELAVLLDVEHLLRMQTFDERKSPSKQLLNYVVASNGGSIKEIRDFLENLDEVRAVQIMDKMAQDISGYNS
ncbi:hypothetical protein WA026_014518 [Henosepilachna vigintioctopunctata]|uniref:IPT/TIG domain-containing protein n=1 Tax=Henosepilachna vigintioctopunctata TaxID=420089 RepID=A0AAW1UKD5_9CUCU